MDIERRRERFATRATAARARSDNARKELLSARSEAKRLLGIDGKMSTGDLVRALRKCSRGLGDAAAEKRARVTGLLDRLDSQLAPGD